MAAALLSRTRRTLARTDLPVYQLSELAQRGETFGVRLATAITDVFQQGHRSVIVVGNDCPSLTSHHLTTAANRLAAGQSVLGADRRGGAYLIGLTAESFRADAFASLDWQTAGLFGQLSALIGDPTLLPSLADINTLEDLRRAWRFVRSRVAALGDLLACASCWWAPLLSGPVYRLTPNAGRAPPVGA